MTSRIATLCLILCCYGQMHVTLTAHLPKSFQTCKLDNPDLDNCLAVNIEDAIRKLKNGAPEIGMTPFEPLEITTLTIGQGSGPVNVQQNFKNVKLYGLTGSKITYYKEDIKHYKLYTESFTPELRLDGDYDMNGKVLLLPIQGNGKFNITLINSKLTHSLTAEPFEKKGKKFWRFTEYKVTIDPERMTFKFDNLFNGNKQLGDEINKVLNENWSAIYQDVRAGYEESFGQIFISLANRVFTRVPITEIFLN